MLKSWFGYIPRLLLFLTVSQLATGYDIVRDYSGVGFFDGWNFYGAYDNLTLGDVVWADKDTALRQGLAYANNAGHVILKVDNVTNVPFNEKRNSVRITTRDAYAVGSLWITDLLHIPYGCSVWPAFWTMGPAWPNGGEIDIMEGINLVSNNQMVLHTTPGCTCTLPNNQPGVAPSAQVDCSQPAGCIVKESQVNSYGNGFNAAKGGVFAAQFDVAGIFIWFWSRPNIPQSLLHANSTSPIDVSQWGLPSASYPSTTCNISQFFGPQNLIFDITLCGIWAGLPLEYLPMCKNSGPSGICYNDNVVGPGDRYDDAYFEINYVRAYTTGRVVPTPAAVAGTPPITVGSFITGGAPSVGAATGVVGSLLENEAQMQIATRGGRWIWVVVVVVFFGWGW